MARVPEHPVCTTRLALRLVSIGLLETGDRVTCRRTDEFRLAAFSSSPTRVAPPLRRLFIATRRGKVGPCPLLRITEQVRLFDFESTVRRPEVVSLWSRRVSVRDSARAIGQPSAVRSIKTLEPDGALHRTIFQYIAIRRMGPNVLCPTHFLVFTSSSFFLFFLFFFCSVRSPGSREDTRRHIWSAPLRSVDVRAFLSPVIMGSVPSASIA